MIGRGQRERNTRSTGVRRFFAAAAYHSRRNVAAINVLELFFFFVDGRKKEVERSINVYIYKKKERKKKTPRVISLI